MPSSPAYWLGQDSRRLGEPGGAAGQILESMVLSELARQLTWADQRATLHHYRTKDELEVDAVLETPDGRFVGIEVKAGATVRSEDLADLRHLAALTEHRFVAGYIPLHRAGLLDQPPLHVRAARRLRITTALFVFASLLSGLIFVLSFVLAVRMASIGTARIFSPKGRVCCHSWKMARTSDSSPTSGMPGRPSTPDAAPAWRRPARACPSLRCFDIPRYRGGAGLASRSAKEAVVRTPRPAEAEQMGLWALTPMEEPPIATEPTPPPPPPAPEPTAPAPAVPERTAEPPKPGRLPAWERALDAWLADEDADQRGEGTVGLQFELRPTSVWLRPVTPGRLGWVRTAATWQKVQFGWTQTGPAAQHHGLLAELLSLATQSPGAYVGHGAQAVVELLAVRSRRIWDVLAEAAQAGVPLMTVGQGPGSVLLAREPVRVSMNARQDDAGIVLTPALMAGESVVGRDAWLLAGDPAHGVVWWESGQGSLRLAPLSRTLDKPSRQALVSGPVRVPVGHRDRFFGTVLPQLRGRVEVVSDGSFELPSAGRARLVLALTAVSDGRLALTWSWRVPFGGHDLIEPLWTSATTVPGEHRDALTRRVVDIAAKPVPDLVDAERRLVESARLVGDQLIRFLGEVLPALSELDDVAIEAPAEVLDLDYHVTNEPPVITFASGDVDQRDWHDLAVEITVGGEAVPFQQLFVALAEEREFLLLPSGAYFSLDRPEFRQLAEMIDESRELEDAPPGVVRVGRYQTSLWADLAQVGEVTGTAAAWQRSLRDLMHDTDAGIDHPAGLAADLRPYQKEGLRWLAQRHARGLGAILADDMGLGKTVQALALICHARAGSAGPFLVVAPASVVANWVSEAHRFAPDLDVRAVTQTGARRSAALAEAVAGADVVVTSYTLFRLEFDGYRAVGWAGLVLDEAQFVKNHQSQAYRCARELPAPVKLAITGTPMENNLAELWSLVSITAPGLLPRLDRFTEYYRDPIEREHDPARLEHLRRRVRPFMLRRRKSDVEVDLPPKQEQVVELELEPAHRKAYQTYLQRERQKVLGLLGDLERNRFEIFRSLTLLRQASLDVALVGHKQKVPSTKLDHVTEQLAGIAAEGHRTLVFSQFTRFLGAVRERLEAAGIACCYLDGKTRDRAKVIDEFKQGTAPVFLISLKAGGFGLNLTEADYCILLDPWWNPATEAQAVDRVHRIGQTRNVMVYRLVARGTIEEKVIALKERKAELFNSVVDDGEFADARLTADDIRFLLD